MSMQPSDYYASAEWISECCGARGFIELQIESPNLATGICCRCKEHASFVREGDPGPEREFSPEQLRIIEQVRPQPETE